MEEEKVISFDEIEKITCPHCGKEQRYEEADSSEEFTTYWGEEVIEKECHDCDKKFFIQERVTRYWEVAKDINDL